MADVEYMHICDYAFTAEGGKACIIGIFDRLRAPTFPATPPRMGLAIKFQGQPHEVTSARIEIGRPNGDVLNFYEIRVTGGEDGGAFIAFTISNLTFPTADRYTIRVLSAGRVLATQSLRVQQFREDANQPVH
jgi:hypothetical protein